MANQNKEILTALKSAMEAEMIGNQFYRNAAQSTSDEQGKAVFLQMADEELRHFNYLRHQYKAIIDTGTYDFSTKLAKEAPAGKDNPIFSSAMRQRIKDCHFEISALTIAMKLELDAVAFYRQCAQKAGSQEAKEFYLGLADWEKEHLQALEQELEMLKEDYWQANHFTPM
ncbi:MAG: ferritin family protein [Deltaproteobacteria bacterium]|nr:ferritin family protein [Candidatus Anaeroferrophillus wilburensis]MBN2890091.1 ferritin family protein [Deltaproteobacteria bacterium]